MDLMNYTAAEQKQVLSAGQVQSLDILALTNQELEDFMVNEYLENPLLDCSGTHGMGHEQEEINKTYEHTVTYERNYEEMVDEEDRRRKDIPMQDQDQIRNFLLYQLPREQFSAEQWALLEFMVDCLDDTGFFTTPLAEVAEKTGMSAEEVRLALARLQELEPYGIFSADLRQ